MCFGNDDAERIQNQAAALAAGENVRRQAAFAPVLAFAQQRMETGYPEYQNIRELSESALGRNLGLARNALQRNIAASGINPNDPVALQLMGDFEADAARSFEELLLKLIEQQNQAKEAGARYLTAIAGGSDPYTGLNLALQAARS